MIMTACFSSTSLLHFRNNEGRQVLEKKKVIEQQEEGKKMIIIIRCIHKMCLCGDAGQECVRDTVVAVKPTTRIEGRNQIIFRSQPMT